MRVAVIQLCSQDDVHANLERVSVLVAEAARAGAELIGLPENFAFMGDEVTKRRIAEEIDLSSTSSVGPIAKTLLELAKTHRVWIVGGGMPERSTDPERPFNTSLLVGPTGQIVGRYRKMHLFDVDLPDGTKLLESAATKRGDEPVVTDLAGITHVDGTIKLGMTICYDLRFPELYRALVNRGVRIVTVPAAFTVTTGKDHWHVLLRARAIENQVFVLAPAQHGRHTAEAKDGGGRRRERMTYGKSLIVDPWGDVVAQCSVGEGVALAVLDFAAQDRVRAALPCLSHRAIP
jgi:predicted amidohydrolase